MEPCRLRLVIVSGLKEVVESQRRRNNAGLSWSYTLEEACSGFFAMQNLQRLLISYFAFWHPNCPMIHKPTFTVENSSPTLVAVMALVGACAFGPASFSDDPLPYDPQDITNPGLRDRLHALQAAYCCILLQTLEGSAAAKRRARRSRYTDSLGAFRSVCSTAVTHGNLLSYLDHPDPDTVWRQFAMKEELIRTLTYIVLLDAAWVILNNTPPRMALQEARIPLASPEACFQAEDPHTWEGTMRVWTSSENGLPQLTVEQVIRLMYKPQCLEQDWARLLRMSSLNLFTIIHPLHAQLFNVRCHPLPECQTLLQRQALDKWKLIHAQRTGITALPEVVPLDANDWWKRTGFPQHALEYWSLADLILTSCEPLPGFDQSANVNGSWASQLLSSYDESDMSQVHDLVSLFSGMNL
ncbi:hypothetical protein LTR09_008363 [Extremus antarcticus]|uniref:Xylanolytic transcriptional activator regulatory domain-containing protein n=1 Tax=Extremus antarcticus TaxID=702011 RepID=A0AAJ0DHU0_9PEZI|nr:hypothetical protein LTR09_008363 [Extremus antarcticus]